LSSKRRSPLRDEAPAPSWKCILISPTLRRRHAFTAGQQVDDAADDGGRVGPIFVQSDARGLDHRARRDAFATARAGIENVVNPSVK
jgi:hypothetical protein